jgi:NAD(P)H-flavin reductase
MIPIQKITAVITAVTDLSDTARDVVFTPTKPFPFIAGHFVNVFMTHNGETLRRAFSISSDDAVTDQFSVSIRCNPQGAVSPLFWNENIVGTEVEIMGPLGLHTAEKIISPNVYLFGFGVGAGVVKALTEHFIRQTNLQSLTIMTGSRFDSDILHKDFFDAVTATHPHVVVSYAVTKPEPNSPHKVGYIQDHLAAYDFTDSTVYVCGQEIACTALVAAVQSQQPNNCSFMVEAFH